MVHHLFQLGVILICVYLADSFMGIDCNYHFLVQQNFKDCGVFDDPISFVGDICRISQSRNLFIKLTFQLWYVWMHAAFIKTLLFYISKEGVKRQYPHNWGGTSAITQIVLPHACSAFYGYHKRICISQKLYWIWYLRTNVS